MLDYLDDVRANWKQNDASNIYDYLKTRAKTGYYKHLRSKRDIKELLRMLRQDLKKNICGISSPELYKVAASGTKDCIEAYHTEVIKCIQYIYYYRGNQLSSKQKLTFFEETSHSYGRTALFFSGGAGFGKFHYGMIKALVE